MDDDGILLFARSAERTLSGDAVPSADVVVEDRARMRVHVFHGRPRKVSSETYRQCAVSAATVRDQDTPKILRVLSNDEETAALHGHEIVRARRRRYRVRKATRSTRVARMRR